MDGIQKQGGLSSGLSNVSMETAMIMHNIQRIIQVIGAEVAGEHWLVHETFIQNVMYLPMIHSGERVSEERGVWEKFTHRGAEP